MNRTLTYHNNNNNNNMNSAITIKNIILSYRKIDLLSNVILGWMILSKSYITTST